jgi:hypothetical protein
MNAIARKQQRTQAGRANVSRECAPDDQLRVRAIQDYGLMTDDGMASGAPLPIVAQRCAVLSISP